MSNEISIKFGSLTFDLITTITDIKLFHKKSPKLSEIPKTDGSSAELGRLKSIIISIEGDVYGADYDAKRTNLDTLKAAFNNGFQKFTKDDDRYIMAQLDSLEEDDVLLRNLSHWKASFVAHYPFWLSETEKTDTRTPASGVGYTIVNAGNAPVRVKIEVTAPAGGIADACQIENTTRQELMKYRGTIAAANVLEIDNRYDTDDFEVKNGGVDDHVNFEGDFIMLSPGNNTIKFTGTPGPTIVTWRDGYY